MLGQYIGQGLVSWETIGGCAECCIEINMTNVLLQASCVTDPKQFSLSRSGGAAAASGLPSLRNRVEWRVC